MQQLPITPLLPKIIQKLEVNKNIVLQAETGAGKSTAVPLALLDAAWSQNSKIIMLEPRRLAARTVARYMASKLGEKVGETVGYRTRFDSKTSSKTRLEVITEGIFTRQIQANPDLPDVSCIIFDEFHERSLEADLALAFTLESQEILREDLRIIVMSATLDDNAIASLIGTKDKPAPILTSKGRSYPVDIIWGSPPRGRTASHGQNQYLSWLNPAIAAIEKAIETQKGSILTFLPGISEIKRLESALKSSNLPKDIIIAPLYGTLPQKSQDAAIKPAPNNQRKIVLATNIAETSLTIEGISIVIDTGLARAPFFDPNSGISRLETINISKAAATQRTGRAGRLSHGTCYRLWAKAAHGGRIAFEPPSLLTADLAPLILNLATWGSIDTTELKWLNPPPEGNKEQAINLLKKLHALDSEGKITQTGKEMSKYPLHPRLSHMVISAKKMNLALLATQIAILIEERDITQGKNQTPDIRERLKALNGYEHNLKIRFGAIKDLKRNQKQLTRRLKIPQNEKITLKDIEEKTGLLLAFAYPDRIAKHRDFTANKQRDFTAKIQRDFTANKQNLNTNRYLLSNGSGAELTSSHELTKTPFLTIADMGKSKRNSQIFKAAPISRTDIEKYFSKDITQNQKIEWDKKTGKIQATATTNLDAITLKETPLKNPDSNQIAEALLNHILDKGLHLLPWNKETKNIRGRIALLKKHKTPPNNWADLSQKALIKNAKTWLLPFLSGITRLADIERLDLKTALISQLTYPQRQALKTEAPTHIIVPTGSRIRLDYTTSETPILPVRVQELFGLKETPTIANGKLPLMLHLLSPAYRPAAITDDLARFWQNGYPQMRADLRGKYPKHAWPEDPSTATPICGTKKQNRAK